MLDHSDSIGVLCEDAAQRAKVDEARDAANRAPRPHLRRSAALEAGRVARLPPPTRPRWTRPSRPWAKRTSSPTSTPRGRPGPPKGCMIRHRNYYAMAAVIDGLPHVVETGDLMLLYLPLAHNFGRLMHLAGPYAGYTTAFVPDPTAIATAIPARAPDGAAERAARLREGAHRGRVGLRRGDRGETAADRLVAARRPRGERATSRREAAAHRPQDPARDRGSAGVREGARAARRPAAHADLGRRPARAGDRRVLRRLRHPHPRGLRPHRVHDRGDDQHAGALPLRHGRPGVPRLRAAARGGRRAADPLRDRLRRLLQGAGGDRRRARRGRLAPHGRRRPRSTPTASSASPTARRTSSSPPAARTSRRRTSRTT